MLFALKQTNLKFDADGTPPVLRSTTTHTCQLYPAMPYQYDFKPVYNTNTINTIHKIGFVWGKWMYKRCD